MPDHKTSIWQHGICCSLLLLVCYQANADPTPSHFVGPTTTLPAKPPTPRTEPASVPTAANQTSIYAANLSSENRGQPVPLHETSERYGHSITPASSGRVNSHEVPIARSPTNDPHLQQVIYNHSPPAKPAAPTSRRLLTPSGKKPRMASGEPKSAPPKTMISQFTQDPTVTTIAAMLFVFGLFLLAIWLVKRAAAKPASVLPEEVVSVLGRKQLAGREFCQLIRVGNKLVLVSVTSEGMKPITEVTDPVEVDRLLGICVQSSPNSSSDAFRQVFERLARKTTPSEFLNNQHASPMYEPTESHTSHPGRHRVS